VTRNWSVCSYNTASGNLSWVPCTGATCTYTFFASQTFAWVLGIKCLRETGASITHSPPNMHGQKSHNQALLTGTSGMQHLLKLSRLEDISDYQISLGSTSIRLIADGILTCRPGNYGMQVNTIGNIMSISHHN